MPNFATLNATETDVLASSTLSRGNLRIRCHTSGDFGSAATSTLGFSSGKYYFEGRLINQTSDRLLIGVVNGNWVATNNIGSDTNSWGVIMQGNVSNGQLFHNTSTAAGDLGSFAVGDIAMCAVDADNGKVWFGRNGTWHNSGDPAAGTNAQFTNLASPPYRFAVNATNNAGAEIIANFGQTDFAYMPPSGFLALSTENLPEPAIRDPKDYFDTVYYSGNNGTQSINTLQFKPDLVWGKATGPNVSNHSLTDSVRGTTKTLFSDLVNVQETQSGITSFDSNGWTMGGWGGYNSSSNSYQAWCWKASDTLVDGTNDMGGAGSGASCSYKVNSTSKFSIVEYTIGTGPDANPMIPHGLGVNLSTTPHFIMIKQSIDNIGDNDPARWAIRHSSHGANGFQTSGDTDSTLGTSSGTTIFRTGYFDSTNFAVGSNSMTGKAGQSYVAYCWAEVEGFSKFGLYQNHVYNSDYQNTSPFVYLGFRPALVIIKSTSNGRRWIMYSNNRKGYNPTDEWLQLDTSTYEQEGTANMDVDFLSNGFKIRGGSGDINTTGESYIYAAWAEAPLKYGLAR